MYPDGTKAVEDFSLSIERGEFVVLIGPSGCGKSTTLRMVNRLIEATTGGIEIDGHDHRSYAPVQLRRRLGYVIQQVGLLPHISIAENISFVLKLNGVKVNERRERARELLSMVGMDPDIYMDRFPRELSGGQQQRIGVLRALAHDPDIILMDEPFGALDPITREQLQDELKRLQRAVHKTILFVTHDMDEALRIADRIVIMRNGQIVQVASPTEMLRNPADEFVADFIGRKRLLHQTSDIQVGEVMTDVSTETVQNLNGRVEDMSIRTDDTVIQAVYMMFKNHLDAVPVVDEAGLIVGVVNREELLALLDDALNGLGEVVQEKHG